MYGGMNGGADDTVNPAERAADDTDESAAGDDRARESAPRAGLRLVIGNRNYSSWSLRPWILMRHAGLDFDEVRVPLGTEEGARLMAELCPAGKVPVLYDGPLVLWDSLAICEYVADKVPSATLWPESVERRAEARAMSAEMHSGFATLRRTMPMNCRRVVRGFEPDFDTRVDIDRLVELFESARARSRSRGDGPWLFGRYSVADAMFAPIASRFRTYGVRVPPDTRAWIDATLDDPPMREWYALAAAETETIADSEVPEPSTT